MATSTMTPTKGNAAMSTTNPTKGNSARNSKKKNSNNTGNMFHDDSEADISLDLPKESTQLMNQISVLKGQVEALYKVLEQKDDTIGKLQAEIGELKVGYNFLSKETSQLKERIPKNAAAIEKK